MDKCYLPRREWLKEWMEHILLSAKSSGKMNSNREGQWWEKRIISVSVTELQDNRCQLLSLQNEVLDWLGRSGIENITNKVLWPWSTTKTIYAFDYINWFLITEPILYTWDKSNLVCI